MTDELHPYEHDLVMFLQWCGEQSPSLDGVRSPCPSCEALCTLHCTECCQIVLDRRLWPECLQRGDFGLPFKVDLILDDKRTCSTGIQALSVLNAASEPDRTVSRIFERAKDDTIELPKLTSDEENAFLLFPGNGSRPFSQVVKESTVDRLVILDCTWKKSSIRLHPEIDALPRVHLDTMPKSSYFWRWHAEGEGMVSTVEAIYYAAREVAATLGWERQEQELVHLLWLFGLQRDIIRRRYADDSVKEAPFSETAKERERRKRKARNKNRRGKLCDPNSS